MTAAAAGGSALAANVMHFARILRRIGLPVGSGRVLTALDALQAIELDVREDVFWTLHAVFVSRRTHSELFRQAFNRFWRAPDGDGMESVVDSDSRPEAHQDVTPAPRRIAEAFGSMPAAAEGLMSPAEEIVAHVSWSAAERLRSQDFETMTAAEIAEARRLVANLRLPIADVPTRRFRPSHGGGRIDMRATLRAMVRAGGALQIHRQQRRPRHPPLVALCDISGSMGAYTRMLLHFLHAITNDRDRVHVFLFGTRLTNVTRELAHRDPDVALARIGKTVQDWSGGTRIGQTLGQFNRLWSRRVLGQGAVVLLISDGLDRDGGEGLAAEMERLRRSCRRLIWLNPLLRYAGFEPKSAGIRAMLPHVDDFRPVHNLDSLAAVVASLQDVSAARHLAA